MQCVPPSNYFTLLPANLHTQELSPPNNSVCFYRSPIMSMFAAKIVHLQHALLLLFCQKRMAAKGHHLSIESCNEQAASLVYVRRVFTNL